MEKILSLNDFISKYDEKLTNVDAYEETDYYFTYMQSLNLYKEISLNYQKILVEIIEFMNSFKIDDVLDLYFFYIYVISLRRQSLKNIEISEYKNTELCELDGIMALVENGVCRHHCSLFRDIAQQLGFSVYYIGVKASKNHHVLIGAEIDGLKILLDPTNSSFGYYNDFEKIDLVNNYLEEAATYKFVEGDELFNTVISQSNYLDIQQFLGTLSNGKEIEGFEKRKNKMFIQVMDNIKRITLFDLKHRKKYLKLAKKYALLVNYEKKTKKRILNKTIS